MATGIWVILVMPAIIALIFSIWVMYSIMVEVSEREDSPFIVLGRDRVRIQIEPSP